MNLKRTLGVQSIVASLLVSAMTVALLGIVLELDRADATAGQTLLGLNEAQTQSANAVTSVVTYFRGLDTLGEVSILFLSIFGVALGMKKVQRNILGYDNALLKIGVGALFPLLLLFGVYIIVHGHLSPGGGFQGGVIIASAFLLQFLAHGDRYDLRERLVSVVEALSGAGFVLAGLLGLLLAGHFLGNFLPLGVMGNLFSGGMLEVIYLFVGLKVAAEIAVLAEHFIKAEHV